MMRILAISFLLSALVMMASCVSRVENLPDVTPPAADSVAVDSVEVKPPLPPEVIIEKALSFDKYTLKDSYPYRDTTRCFQWEKIKDRLTLIERLRREPANWGVLQNYKNRNGEAPLVKVFRRDAYKRVSDTLGVERYQSVPLYMVGDTVKPDLYGRDGSLVRIESADSASRFVRVSMAYDDKEWVVPRKYLKHIGDTVSFDKAIFVDRLNQNIATLERTEDKWLVRSMNPATTGRYRPPYAQRTPVGMFLLQEKKARMVYLKDGSKEKGGFAPYASRFTNGAYIHGVPVNAPRTAMIEYSPSLGTTPRSHMCVRNATSHSKFIYDWASINETIVFVLE